MACSWTRVPFGSLGPVTPLGVASSYGLGASGVRRAFDRGVNVFYWGSLRKSSFGEGVADLARGHRDELLIVVQSYSRVGALLRPSLRSALKRLRVERADVLLLGLWNRPVPGRILAAAERCVADGLARGIMVSCHHRPAFGEHAAEPRLAAIMTRYNAAHPGAEDEVFPALPAREQRPLGVVAYTATSWGRLLDPARIPAGLARPRASDCYRFQLSHPRVDLAFCGPRDEAQLDEAMQALDRGPMDADEIAWMKQVGRATG